MRTGASCNHFQLGGGVTSSFFVELRSTKTGFRSMTSKLIDICVLAQVYPTLEKSFLFDFAKIRPGSGSGPSPNRPGFRAKPAGLTFLPI
jgi:hypothetical protein